jgi:hypothetical protein
MPIMPSGSKIRSTLNDHFDAMFSHAGHGEHAQKRSTSFPSQNQPSLNVAGYTPYQDPIKYSNQQYYPSASSRQESFAYLNGPPTPSLFPSGDDLSMVTPISPLGAPLEPFNQQNNYLPFDYQQYPIKVETPSVFSPYSNMAVNSNSQLDYVSPAFQTGGWASEYQGYNSPLPAHSPEGLMSAQFYSPPHPQIQAEKPASLFMNRTSMEYEDEEEDDGKVLVGMGLYDAPDTSNMPELEPDVIRIPAIARIQGSHQVAKKPLPAMGKGLKLEETWVPPPEEEKETSFFDDDDEDEEDEDDEVMEFTNTNNSSMTQEVTDPIVPALQGFPYLQGQATAMW